MLDNLNFKELKPEHILEIAELGCNLNPHYTIESLRDYLTEMFAFETYYCFGLFLNSKLIAVSSAWITIRFYCGKQLEVDNVIVDPALQSQGIGAEFFKYIEIWAKENNCNSIELNTYVKNSRSHKFYFNMGYSIIGYHFQKLI